jgi:malate dehydrogenase (quinone)
MTEYPHGETNSPDVALVGAGIMSATLAVMLKGLDPTMHMALYEGLGSAAQESSNAWNRVPATQRSAN